MAKLFRAYRWLNILSIDVAAGAVICAYFFSRMAAVSIRPAGLAVLGLAVWSIYTCDHLIDARHLQRMASTERHRFHQVHFLNLLIAVLLTLSVICFLLFFIKPEVFLWGQILLALVIVYMVINRYLNYLKELMVAILYCAGIFLPTLAQSDLRFQFLMKPESVIFLLLVLLNLFLFSWYETDQDKEDGHQSFALHFGPQFTKLVVVALFLLQGTALTFLFLQSKTLAIPLVMLMMTVGLLLLLLFPSWFKHAERYRLLGDAVFIFPLILFLP